MRTLCDRCNKEINTNGCNKIDHAFKYSIDIDTEPNIGTAYANNKTGYLCCKCANTIYNAISEGLRPISSPKEYSFETGFSQ